MVANFQATSQRIGIRWSPVVAARGWRLGGGCEFQMHSARTVAPSELSAWVEAVASAAAGGWRLNELVRASQRDNWAATCSPN